MQQPIQASNLQTPVPRARYEFLKNEISRWQEQNILNRGQAEEILSRYSAESGKQHGYLVLMFTGGSIVAAGTMLLISTNWQGVPMPVKGFAILALMLACCFSAFHLKGKSPLKTILSESLIFLGCVFFGGAAILISQQFHITGNQPELILWSFGIAPLILLFRSYPSAILCAGITLYCVLQRNSSGAPCDLLLIGCTLSSLFCAYFTRSQVALVASLGALVLSLGFSNHNFDEFVVLFFGISCFILHLFHEHSKRWQIMATPFLLVSFVCVLGALLMLIGEYSAQHFFERVSLLRVQIGAILTLGILTCLVKSPACKSLWSISSGFAVIGAVCLFCSCGGGEDKLISYSTFLVANLFYLFYFASSVENRLIQFIPIASLTIFALTFFANAPGGALIGSGIAFGVGLVLMICSFAALAKSMRDVRAVPERSLQ